MLGKLFNSKVENPNLRDVNTIKFKDDLKISENKNWGTVKKDPKLKTIS